MKIRTIIPPPAPLPRRAWRSLLIRRGRSFSRKRDHR